LQETIIAAMGCVVFNHCSVCLFKFSVPRRSRFSQSGKNEKIQTNSKSKKKRNSLRFSIDTVRFLLFIIAHVVQSLMRKTKKSNNKQHNLLS
jgi:heterodisulfide reductase subunit B